MFVKIFKLVEKDLVDLKNFCLMKNKGFMFLLISNVLLKLFVKIVKIFEKDLLDLKIFGFIRSKSLMLFLIFFGYISGGKLIGYFLLFKGKFVVLKILVKIVKLVEKDILEIFEISLKLISFKSGVLKLKKVLKLIRFYYSV